MFAYNSYKPTDKERDFVGKLINIQPNDISYKFFSDINVDLINNKLIEEIMNITLERYGKKLKIEPQRKHIVIGIMRHIYFKNITNTLPTDEEVERLNKEVLRQMIPVVTHELISYMRYIEDRNNIVPVTLPKPDNKRTINVQPFSKTFDF